jgi:hypothetical protein
MLSGRVSLDVSLGHWSARQSVFPADHAARTRSVGMAAPILDNDMSALSNGVQVGVSAFVGFEERRCFLRHDLELLGRH